VKVRAVAGNSRTFWAGRPSVDRQAIVFTDYLVRIGVVPSLGLDGSLNKTVRGNTAWVQSQSSFVYVNVNPLTPNDPYCGRTAPLTSKRYILYIYSTNIGTEYFKHGIYSPSPSLQNAVCFIILTYLVLVLFTFYIQVC
jgi:hypothetical protein